VPRFNIGDTVIVKPQFAHFFADDCGVVELVKEDRFRFEFNEYVVRFPDDSRARFFEFEISRVELGRGGDPHVPPGA